LAADYPKLKEFFKRIKKNHLITKPRGFYGRLIDIAHENKDPDTVIDAYLYSLEYNEFTVSHLLKVLENQRYDLFIDHALIQHVFKEIEARNAKNDPMFKLHQALYYMKTKGYLSAVDLINDMASQQTPIPNNEFLKENLFVRFLGEEGSKIEKEFMDQFR